MAEPVNEIEAAALAHKRGQDAAEAATISKGDWPIVPIAIGAGSAAVAAALLYAGLGRKK